MTALLLFGVVILILLNGFFVAAEFALVRVRRAHLETEAEAGSRAAARGLTLLDDLSRYLSACQLGITLTSLGIGFLGEPAIASVIEPLIGEALPREFTLAISIGLAYVIATSLHITVGEQIPKIWSIQRSIAATKVIAGPLYVFARVFHPFIVLLNGA